MDKLTRDLITVMEFMGWQKSKRHTLDPEHNGGKNDYDVYVKEDRVVRSEDVPYDIVYHQNWNVLIDVIDDIRYARRFYTINWNEYSHPSRRLYRMIEESLLNLSIEQTFAAVVKWINYYNISQSDNNG